MINNPKISVIIPVYNPGYHFHKCMNSIINQTYTNLEIILVDDGSTDGSGRICDEYMFKDDRIVVIHQINAGVSAARNVGLEHATGDYVNFPDSDDYIDLDTYETLLEVINAEQTEAVCFEYYTTYADREFRHHASDGRYGIFNTEGSINELLFSNRSFLCTKLLPMKAVRNLRFLENIYRDEDTIFCMMALHNVKSTAFIEKSMYHYVQSEESACRGVFRPNQLSAIEAIPIMEEFLADNYPKMIKKWRSNYMGLMIMLYADIYADGLDYQAEKKSVYNTFRQLKKGVSVWDYGGIKNVAKYGLFSISPEMFCKIHQMRFGGGNA